MAAPARKIQLYRNPNSDFGDTWVCGHVECHVAKAAEEITICEDCVELLDAGAEYERVQPTTKEIEAQVEAKTKAFAWARRAIEKENKKG